LKNHPEVMVENVTCIVQLLSWSSLESYWKQPCMCTIPPTTFNLFLRISTICFHFTQNRKQKHLFSYVCPVNHEYTQI